MKNIFLLLSLNFAVACSFAQKESIESIRRELIHAATDSLKIERLIDLGEQYAFTKPDSGIYYFRRALALAETNDFKTKALICRQRIARFLSDNGNYIEALRMANETIEMARQLKDTVRLFFSLRLVLWLYGDLGIDRAMDYADSLLLLTNSAAISNYKNAAGLYEMANRYKADVFSKVRQDDSASLYYHRALHYAKKSPDPLFLGLASEALAKYYFQKGDYDSAFYYGRITVPIAVENLRTDIKMHTQIVLANMFMKKGDLDSAFLYATVIFRDASNTPDSAMMEESARLLSNIYKKQGNADSAFKYLEYSVTLNKLMAAQEKQKSVREVLFKQALQQQQEEQLRKQAEQKLKSNIKIYSLAAGLAVLFLVAFLFYRNSRQKQKDAIRIHEAYHELKATQAQLIQSEKMASLGELTAGIAHEIQNPLNFVNNFSEVNKELTEELESELKSGNSGPAIDIARDIRENSEKINHHGKRAESIVKGMLQHSRTSSGQKEPTDINALCEEYLRLAYHGLRAKDKSFNARYETHFDPALPPVNVVPQDIGRVILNLVNNAFYAVSEKKAKSTEPYDPLVAITTRKRPGKIEIIVEDNGPGIPEKIKDKIFQPFFTTKPTGQGTGLGLSLAYDTVTKGHGGELKVETPGGGEGTEFVILLPY